MYIIAIIFHVCLICVSFFLFAVSGLSKIKRNIPGKDPLLTISFVFLSASLFVFFVGLVMLEFEPWKENLQSMHTAEIEQMRIGNQSVYLLSDGTCYHYVVKQNDGTYSYEESDIESTEIYKIYTGSNKHEAVWHTRHRNWLYFYEEDSYCTIYVSAGSIIEKKSEMS